MVEGSIEYKIEITNQFKKDVKLLKKRNFDIKLISIVTRMLSSGQKLNQNYRDHALKGNYVDCRECHLKPNVILIYKKEKEKLILLLIRIRSHSDLFE